jgi:hypothetical protein
VSAEIQTPPQAGKLILRLTLVQEHVAWFDDVDPRNSYEALVELVHPAVKAIEPMPQAGVAV